tara:strand:+ start:140 stop:376 length:237 start_codon:yes stop_codon:yes gene_type:complete
MNRDDSDSIRISAMRDDICDAAMTRIIDLVNQEKFHDAHSIYEEFYYWFDPEHINKELTIFTRIDDIKRLYESTAEDS